MIENPMNLTHWLGAIDASIEAQIAHYDGSNLLKRIRREPGIIADTDDASWDCNVTSSPVLDRPDAIDITARFRLTAGQSEQTSVGISLTFEKWSSDRYVVLPSAVYAGNRFDARAIPYPPILPAEARGVDVPPIITDVPRLNIGEGPSRIQQLTRDLSTPAAGFFDPGTRRGFWLLTNPQTYLGDSGIDLEESGDRSQATLMVMAPGVREGLRFEGNRFGKTSEDRGANFTAGEEVTIRLRLFSFDCPDIPALFDRFVDIRKYLTGPVALTHGLPFSAAWAIQEEKYNRDNWAEDDGYYSVGLRENVHQSWQIGWVGGLMATHPLLMAGSEVSYERALRTFDFAFSGQGESGLFYGCGDGKRWYGDDFRNMDDTRFHLIRKSADTLYFLLKQFDLLDKQGHAVPPSWDNGTKRCADAFVRLWNTYGQLGQFADAGTGEILIGGSTSAGIAPAGLALAYQRYGNADYLRVAEASANQFYERDVLAGITTGGPGEILQCPDSESAFGLLESFVVLYEATGERHWADRAEDMARQCASWCVSYDWPFPEWSLFGKMGMKAAGSVWANVQNKHSAPGICTLSGDSLWKLYRATGDQLYLEMLRETAHNITQYLSREDRPVGDMPSGWINERVNLSDWDNNIGGIFRGSCWCEVSCMLTYAEIPGLYVQTDTGLIVAFDHIDVTIESHDADGMTINITNPTAYYAQVRIFSEKASEVSQPIGQNALWGRQTLSLQSGETQALYLPV